MATKQTIHTASERFAERLKGRWLIPVIGNMPPAKQFKIVGGAMAATLITTIATAVIYVHSERYNTEQNKIASEMTTNAQRIAKTAGLAVRGDKKAFSDLAKAKAEFGESLTVLSVGGDHNGVSIPMAAGDQAEKLASLASDWRIASAQTDRLLTSQKALEQLGSSVDRINLLDTNLYGKARFLESDLSSMNASARQIDLSRKMAVLTQRMAKNANALAATQQIDPTAAFLLGKDINTFNSYVQALMSGSSILGVKPLEGVLAKSDLAGILEVYKTYAEQISFIQKNQADLILAKEAFARLADGSELLSTKASDMLKTYESQSSKNTVWLILSFVFLFLFLALMVTLLKVFSDQTETARQAADLGRENKVQQQAVLTLLDEIAEVADGDLTINATVNDSFTGAIADSINFTVGELRRVIQNIMETSLRVQGTANEARQVTGQMAMSAKDQYERLSQTGSNIIKMTTRMDDIAKETGGAVSASRKSLEVSQDGIQVVNDTIERMNTIRNTIQDTSKKIKFLGESSTAIGEVTGLIRDITKQIDILALNAAIQAASAGEAGRGFAVVAKEVQRLALSSAEAAKKIDVMVLRIQEDAQGAVAAMEESTKEVVEGARLTDQAGMALREIGQTVALVAKSIEEITAKIEVESEEATNVSLDMRLLQEYTEKALESTEQASRSVEQVKNISEELRESVANFKV